MGGNLGFAIRVLIAVVLLLATAGGMAATSAVSAVARAHAVSDASPPPLRFAVLAFRPPAEMLKRWQPLTSYLEQHIDSHRVELRALSYPELEQAVHDRQVDIVLTQPAHYVALSVLENLYSPLASLVELEQGQALTQFGGVVIVKANDTRLQRLADLKGKRIATSSVESLGAFQAQAYELLRLGIDRSDFSLIETGQQDAVLQALADGRADAGFVRSGLLEQMAREGKVDLAAYRVLAADEVPNYPMQLSTRLYPQWALAAMPWLDPVIARQVAAAVLSLPHDGEIARAARISGFSVPGDYRSVEQLMRALRVPPFDARVPLLVVWEDHRALVLFFGGVIAVALFWLAQLFQRSRRQRLIVQRALAESEQHFRTLANHGSALIWTSGTDKLCNYFNEPWLRFTGRSLEQELGGGWVEGVHPDDRECCIAIYIDHFDRRAPFSMEYRLRHADSDYRWIIDEGNPRYDSNGQFVGYIGFCYDITERKRMEERLGQAASVFAHASEGILITDAAAIIVDVNRAFTELTGYTREEAVGRSPSLLSSGRHNTAFYAAMWQQIKETGKWQGEIWNRRKNGEVFAEMLTITEVCDARGTVQQYVGLFHDITEVKLHEQQLERIAHFDALTQLPNRLLLTDRLELAIRQAERRKLKIAVLYIDLDGFKAVNDTYGHATGDRLLIELTKRMKEVLREGDTLGRLGGDEFVAVLIDLEDSNACLPVLRRLLQVASSKVSIEDLLVQVSASIGASFYPQPDEVSADQLLRQADQAMYQAKQSGKNRYHLFDDAQDRALRGRHEGIERIREALGNQEFVLFYQPKVNMRTGVVVGAEALIRWQHPEQGLLPPGMFLPMIEEHELIIQLGDWVIESALGQMDAWLANGLHLPVSVNVAGRQIQDPAFLGKLRGALRQHPAVARQLELEVLESSALNDINHASETIESCLGMGVGFALDDFGTGYSSLTYLKRLPARVLKIDHSFVRDMLDDVDDLAILDGIIGLAESFQRQVLAEGVETTAHGEMLLRLGCELGQGYAIARPMPAADIPGWIDTWQSHSECSGYRRIAHGDLPVLFAMTEHRAWINAMLLHLQGKQSAPPPLDHHQCKFGQWLDQTGVQRYAGHPQQERIFTLHQAIHQLAGELVDLKRRGQVDEARARADELTALRDALLNLLGELLDAAPQD